MKQMLIFAVVLTAISLASCKKNFLCECTLSDNGQAKSVVTYNLDGMNKKDAESSCKDHETTAGVGGATLDASCKLK